MDCRTIDLIIPLAEMDARSRNFDSCQQKIDCVISMLKGPIVGTDKSLDSRKVLDTSKKLQVSKEFIKVRPSNEVRSSEMHEKLVVTLAVDCRQ